MLDTKESLKNKIADARSNLNKLIVDKKVQPSVILKLSEELDQLIIQYYQLSRKNQRGSACPFQNK